MIDCPACKISFSPRYRICPRCKAYEAKLEDRIEYLTDSAEAALDQGAIPADVESMLLEEGIPPLVAREIVSARARKVKRAARSYGLFRLLGALGVVLLGITLVVIGLLASPSGLGSWVLGTGLSLAVAGAWPFLLGVYNVLTGRDQQ